LTIGVYAKASIHDLTGAVEGLPDLTNPAPESEPLRATETDSVKSHCHKVAAQGQRAEDGMGRQESPLGGMAAPLSDRPNERNPLVMMGVDATGRTVAGVGRAGIEPATPGFSVLCSTS
jgi:hypothetical protein